MNCRSGHENPEENRFCGTCGDLLGEAGQPTHAIEAILEPLKLEWEPPVPSPHMPPRGKAELDLQPAVTSVAVAATALRDAPRRHDPWEAKPAQPTAGDEPYLRAPDNSGVRGNGGYSYLFKDEPERPHTALWALLLILLLLGGGVYAKWGMIRDFETTRANMHSVSRRPGPQEPTASGAATGGSAAPLMQMPTTDKQMTAKAAGQLHTPSKPEEVRAEREENSAASSKSDQTTLNNADSKANAANQNSGAEQELNPKKAVESRHDKSNELVAIGERYLYGQGATRSCEQAVIYFKAAAAKQNAQAFSHLGALHATGECVPMDRPLAYAWFQRAHKTQPSNPYFEQNLTLLWREMSPDERQRASASAKHD